MTDDTTQTTTAAALRALAVAALERAGKATPGPWKAVEADNHGEDGYVGIVGGNYEFHVARLWPDCPNHDGNADLIESAIFDVPTLAAALVALLDLRAAMLTPLAGVATGGIVGLLAPQPAVDAADAALAALVAQGAGEGGDAPRSEFNTLGEYLDAQGGAQ